MNQVTLLGDWSLGGGHPFFLIGGPCVIESEGHCLELAGRLRDITANLGIPFIFKASFDKANRTSLRSYRGPGLEEGLRILARVKAEVRVPVLSDVHEVSQVDAAAAVLDVLQIPAFLCRQTDLILAAAHSGRIVNVKKGQFLAPWDVGNIVEKVWSAAQGNLLITERGSSFGYNHLVVDFKSLPIIRRYGVPVVFDATHSVQLPGGAGSASSGQVEFVDCLARAAVAVGVDGLFLEVHDRPEAALSDGPNSLPLGRLESLLKELQAVDQLIKAKERAGGR
jgi:2-dehydro-3-deoxyphosphooctonate aldolase (KDO 8-P synthase)